MKTVISILVGAYFLIFITGCIGAKFSRRDLKPFCESLFSKMPTWALILSAPGEANAWLDMGIYPKAKP